MKKLLVLTLLSALAAVSMAQTAGPTGVGAPPQTGPGKAGKIDRKEMEKINEEILAKLNLTADQQAKLKTHREEMEAKVKELRQSAKGSPDKEALKEKVKALRKENQEFMKTLLTKEQMRDFQKMRRQEMKELRDKAADPTKP